MGVNNTAFQFYGTNNAYVSTPALNFNSNAMTIVALVQQTAFLNAWGTIVSEHVTTGVGGDVFIFAAGNDKLTPQMCWANENTTLNFYPSFYFGNGVWSFIAVSLDASQFVIYGDVGDGNGLQSAPLTGFVPESLALAGTLAIGQEPGYSRAWNGWHRATCHLQPRALLR